ncbi:ECF transporter S component [Pseudoflavonifractor capillosus]|uniref:ECF transporter S component n=1 Tax=Pseudoflavonifractor capillosus TaxID=106588 RepID=A0A921MNB4_9FIRM|nr:ECF transporter S component [Pseudoflavonifractor capillosus]HJG86966.1 ECF transporter S component [Pseudoflavonifractor capillosus]
MKNRRKDARWMAGVAMMAAIVVLLANTPLGMIPLVVTKATTVHIPVILGAILFGPLAGGILGGVFGVCSVIINTFTPALTSFAFSPFMSTTGLSGAVKALWVAVGCRILIGVAAGWLWRALSRTRMNSWTALSIVGFTGSMVNTVTVMGSIFLLFTQQYAQAKEVALEAVSGLILTTVLANGIPEAIVSTVLVAVIGKNLLRFAKPRLQAA